MHGDREALGRALGNLLSNAWKYTRPEGKEIEVATRADAKHVFISVTDNGVGIAPARAASRSSTRSIAARRPSRRGGPGSGLGLAIVRAIVKAHRGRIDVRSEVDQRRQLPDHASPPLPGSGVSDAATSARVVIVEDDDAIAEGLALNLQAAGLPARGRRRRRSRAGDHRRERRLIWCCSTSRCPS